MIMMISKFYSKQKSLGVNWGVLGFLHAMGVYWGASLKWGVVWELYEHDH